jgi:hypothetical protein
LKCSGCGTDDVPSGKRFRRENIYFSIAVTAVTAFARRLLRHVKLPNFADRLERALFAT